MRPMLEIYIKDGELMVTQRTQIWHSECDSTEGQKTMDLASHYDLLVDQGHATPKEREKSLERQLWERGDVRQPFETT